MPVSTTTVKFEYTGNASTTAFPFTAYANASGDIKVYVDGVAQSSGFTTTGSGSAWTVTFGTAPAIGADVLLKRITTDTQATDYQDNSAFSEENVEGDLDKRTARSQEIGSDFDAYALKFNPLRAAPASANLPSAVDRANKALTFDANGEPQASTLSADDLANNALNVNFDPTGTGAVARTLESKSRDSISLEDFGAVGDWNGTTGTDDSVAIQKAIDAALELMAYSSSNGATVFASVGKSYLHATGLVIPPRVTLDMRGGLLSYSGTGVAVTLGDSDSVLSYSPGFINYKQHLQDKASTGVRLRGTRGATVIGEVEGLYAPFDSTRTNIAVDIDGVDVGNFFNYVRVLCNHIHRSFYIRTTGSVKATDTYFDNCSAFGDVATDATSVGFDFDGVASGQGSQIMGGNIESCGKGLYIQTQAGRVSMFGTRFEPGSNTVDIELGGTGTGGNVIFGFGQTVIVDGSASSDQNLVQNANAVLGLPDKGISVTNRLNLVGDAGDTNYIIGNETNTGTGKLVMQQGGGSSNYGGAIIAYSNAHASKPGDIVAGISNASGGAFRINSAADDSGGDFFVVDSATSGGIGTSSTASNTNTPSGATARQLPIYDVSGTLLGYIPIYGSAW